MTFSDIITEGFLESMTTLSVASVATTLAVALVIGLFIYQIYKKAYQSVVYTKSFNLSLVMMKMITSLVILAISSNIILSLGMVGALSIVRFRAAIKDPMDIVFMFFAIASGIVTGAGLYTLAIIGAVVVGLVIMIFNINISNDKPYMLMVQFSDEKAEQIIVNQLRAISKKYFIKSKSISHNLVELTIELRIKDGEVAFVNDLNAITSVAHAMLVSSNEYSM
ncbi:MAG: DUF4956 domain-containing protein [Vallitaleaceae bacterium]|jgi:uncharacterized membrane protein YhiD involved in acid resistance|nr:DUF4956 domain-containing protein [Vallitaleaceae bacterium]